MIDLQPIVKDVEIFAGLAGARDVRLSDDGQAITYYKRDLYNYNTPCRIQVRQRALKQGGIAYTLVTSYVDVDGRKKQLKSPPVYSISSLYHEAARHCDNIIA